MALLRGFCLAMIALTWALSLMSAQAQPVDGGHARVELSSERSLAMPGETVWMGLSFEIDPNWHIYWVNPGAAGIPPEITWKDTSHSVVQSAGAFEWP